MTLAGEFPVIDTLAAKASEVLFQGWPDTLLVALSGLLYHYFIGSWLYRPGGAEVDVFARLRGFGRKQYAPMFRGRDIDANGLTRPIIQNRKARVLPHNAWRPP
jgi:hypothetical protein